MERGRAVRDVDHNGGEVREHGEAAARRLIAEGLKREGLRPAELGSRAKGDPRKARIASQVRSTTTVPLQWLADQLSMGTAANIFHACRRHDADSRLCS